MKTLTRSAAVLAMVIAAVADASGVPAVLTQQGRLLNTNGTPATGPVTLVFSIYDTTSSTVALWTETQSAPLGDGYFVVQLGRTTPLSSTLWTGATRFLGLKVGADPEMTPRQELVSVPYALAAADAIGDIHPTSVIVNGSTVINGAGAWVGAPTGLVGPQGAMGAPGATGVPGQSVVGASEAAGVNCPSGGANYTSASGVNYVCNGAPAPVGSVIVNGTAQQTSASFNIDGSGTCGTSFKVGTGTPTIALPLNTTYVMAKTATSNYQAIDNGTKQMLIGVTNSGFLGAVINVTTPDGLTLATAGVGRMYIPPNDTGMGISSRIRVQTPTTQGLVASFVGGNGSGVDIGNDSSSNGFISANGGTLNVSPSGGTTAVGGWLSVGLVVVQSPSCTTSGAVTDCMCPANTFALSGGGFTFTGAMRESRALLNGSSQPIGWRVTCVNTSFVDVRCSSGSVTCSRIAP